MDNTPAEAAPAERVSARVSSTSLTPPHPNLLVRWFVQYNPLFTASAFCVLVGVFLLSREFGRDGRAGFALAGTVEVYQWLVIGTAALLYRRLLERRPAVFLGIIALVFLVDPTLNFSALAASDAATEFGGVAVVVGAFFVVSFALKFFALAWAFRLKLSRSAKLLPVLGAVVVTLTQNARVFGDGDDGVSIVVAFAVFIVAGIARAAPLTFASRQALSDEAQVMFPRVTRGVLWILAAGALYQTWNTTLANGAVAVVPVVAAIFLGRALFAKSEGEAWAFIAAGAASFIVDDGATFTVAGVPLLAATLLASHRFAPRFSTAGIVVTFAAIAVAARDAHDDVTLFAMGGVTMIALAVLFVRTRSVSAIGVLVAMVIGGADVVGLRGPQGGLQWGLTLLGAGFALLPAGLAVHRRLAQAMRDHERRFTADEHSPSTPAAIGL